MAGHANTHPVVRLADLELIQRGPDRPSTRFGAALNSFGTRLGMGDLGLMYVTVEPGKRAFPFHNHLGNDEAFVILEGSGIYRFGAGEHPVQAGDVCLAPRGGPDTAHQLINTGTDTLRYVGISTTHDPDIAEYPDSGKFAAIGIAPGTSFMQAHLLHVGKREDGRGYWDEEDLG